MIAIGVDPGIADKKPLAIVSVDLQSFKVIGFAEQVCKSLSLWERFRLWRVTLMAQIERDRPSLVAIENARSPGGRGYRLQTLVDLLEEVAEGLGIPVIRVNPQQAKSAVLRHRPFTAARVATNVRSLVINGDSLPETKGHDYEAAVSIALAGAAIANRERRR